MDREVERKVFVLEVQNDYLKKEETTRWFCRSQNRQAVLIVAVKWDLTLQLKDLYISITSVELHTFIIYRYEQTAIYLENYAQQ